LCGLCWKFAVAQCPTVFGYPCAIHSKPQNARNFFQKG
jgi:hypothetical protein